jgi:hypothetical protein
LPSEAWFYPPFSVFLGVFENINVEKGQSRVAIPVGLRAAGGQRIMSPPGHLRYT